MRQMTDRIEENYADQVIGTVDQLALLKGKGSLHRPMKQADLRRIIVLTFIRSGDERVVHLCAGVDEPEDRVPCGLLLPLDEVLFIFIGIFDVRVPPRHSRAPRRHRGQARSPMVLVH